MLRTDYFKGKNLLVLGDSIMNGSGNGDFGVGEYLAKDMGFTLYKYCIGGARVGFFAGTSWVVDQVKKAVNDGVKPDYIVFDGFTNDCCKSDGENFDVPIGNMPAGEININNVSTTDDFSTCFSAVCLALTQNFADAKILFVRPHKMGRREDEGQRRYGDRAAEICAKYNIAVADIYGSGKMNTFIPELRDKYTFDSYDWGRGDCTHPNTLGYEEIYMPFIEGELVKL